MTTTAQRRVFITGAGSGLGRALALRFAAGGWRVAVTDVDEASATQTLKMVRSAGADGWAGRCDVTVADDFDAARERIEVEWGGVDVVINNAGVGAGGSVADTSLEDWAWVLDIDLMGVVRGCRAFAPMLAAQGHGHIVNVASFAGIASIPGMAAYNTAKAGVIGLSESLRAELDPAGVGVTVVCPAFFQTNLMDRFRSPDSRHQAIVTRIMKKADVTAEQVAHETYRAVRAGRFLVLTHRQARWLYRLKRLSPETYFRRMLKSTRSFAGPPAPRRPKGETSE